MCKGKREAESPDSISTCISTQTVSGNPALTQGMKMGNTGAPALGTWPWFFRVESLSACCQSWLRLKLKGCNAQSPRHAGAGAWFSSSDHAFLPQGEFPLLIGWDLHTNRTPGGLPGCGLGWQAWFSDVKLEKVHSTRGWDREAMQTAWGVPFRPHFAQVESLSSY